MPAAHAAAGLAFSGANVLPTDFLRPYQGYSDITYYYFDADADYNSLQVSAQRRFAKGVTFGIAYTLSKTMTTVSDDATFTRLVDPHNDYALANFDRTHFFVGTFVWDLPKLGSKLGGSRFIRTVVDNWTHFGQHDRRLGQPHRAGTGDCRTGRRRTVCWARPPAATCAASSRASC